MRITSNLLAALAVATQCGCASTSGMPVQFERLVFDNASPDVVRVSISLGDRELLVGRVEPMRQVELRIRAGALPANVVFASVLVRAVGTPGISSMAVALQSDSYPLADLVRQAWRYSGSRVLPYR